MDYEQIYLKTRDDWRNWLLANHDKTPGIWLLHYKKHTRRQSIDYNDAVEEALCFGWIDSLVKRIDKELYMQKYTPRKPQSSWSESNKARVKKMIEEGRMTAAGLKIIEAAKKNGRWDERVKPMSAYSFSEDLNQLLISDSLAYKHFRTMSPAQIKMHTAWIMSAKMEDTRIRRMGKMMELLREGKRVY